VANEHRKFKRKALTHRATLMMSGEDDTRSCIVKDASDTGARLKIPAAQELPEGFTLLLSSVGGPRRNCRVVWRDGDAVGVRFEKR
jgi:hypothetical protein